MAGSIHVRGAREHNLKNVDVGHPARLADRDHRPVRLRQVVAGVRHDLRRGPAPLCRVAVGLCAPVPGADGQAGRRRDRRAVAGDLDRAEDHLPQPALHRRHGDRNPRLHAPAVGAGRRAVFAGDRPADRGADGQPDGRPRAGDAGGHAAAAAGAGGARPQGRVPQGAGRAAAQGLHPRQGRRQAVRNRRGPGAEPQDQARDRGGGGSHRGARRHRRRGWPTVSRPRSALSDGMVYAEHADGRVRTTRADACSRRASPARCRASRIEEIEPRLFSFNSPHGACPACDGLGTESFFDAASGGAGRAAARWPVARSRRGPGRRARITTRRCKAWRKHFKIAGTHAPGRTCRSTCATRCCMAPARRRSRSPTRTACAPTR